MPSLKPSLLECIVLDGVPNCPKDRTALALTVSLDAMELAGVETYFNSVAKPEFRIGYGADELQAELNVLRATVSNLEIEVQRYRTAYDKNPSQEVGRFGLVEVD